MMASNRLISSKIELIDAEITWCINHPDSAFSKEYRKGFINGLIQAKYLITAIAEPHTDTNERETR